MKRTANIATFPARFESLKLTLKSIEGQFDEVRIYLNEYKDMDDTFLKNALDELGNCTIQMGEDITDNGKFYWLKEAKDEYYFTLDDDIIYPSTYVEDTIKEMGGCSIVSYHGRILLGENRNYYGGNRVFHCLGDVLKKERIDVGGTGVMCIDTRIFKCDIAESPFKRMSDIILSFEAAKQKILIFVLPHKKGYFDYTPQPTGTTIFETEHKKAVNQNKLANQIYKLNYQ